MYIFNYFISIFISHSAFKNQRGVTLVEYALIIGLITIACIFILSKYFILSDK